jgi:hypothetical protein
MTSFAGDQVMSDDAKEAHYVKMQRVAEQIINPAPTELLDFLSDRSFGVRYQDSIDAIWPTRKGMSDLVAQAGTLAILVD